MKKTRQDARAQRAEKPMYLKDYHRETLLQGQIPGAIQEDKNATKQPMTHVEEQARLKAEFKVIWLNVRNANSLGGRGKGSD